MPGGRERDIEGVLFCVIFAQSPTVFRCGYCISIRGFVRPLVGLSVGPSVGPSVGNAFVKMAKSVGKSAF